MDLTAMDARWISEKTGVPVTQVQPGAVVRVEADGAVGSGGLINVLAEPEGIVRQALRRAGWRSRAPVTTLRWDTTAKPGTHATVRSQRWHAAQVGPAHAVTRVVAEFDGRRSGDLLIGGPVLFTHTNETGFDASLAVPILGLMEASAGPNRTNITTITGEAFAAIDPDVNVRVLTPHDGEFHEHFAQLLAHTAVMYSVASSRLMNRFYELIRERFGHDEFHNVRLPEPLERHLDEGEVARYELTIANIPDHGVPILVAGFDQARRLIGASELAVAGRCA